jgi:hypothetical protein
VAGWQWDCRTQRVIAVILSGDKCGIGSGWVCGSVGQLFAVLLGVSVPDWYFWCGSGVSSGSGLPSGSGWVAVARQDPPCHCGHFEWRYAQQTALVALVAVVAVAVAGASGSCTI